MGPQELSLEIVAAPESPGWDLARKSRFDRPRLEWRTNAL
jgi:hypothetical protein